MGLSKKDLLFKLIEETTKNFQASKGTMFIIAFIGLTGVGKSTIAHLLQKKSNLPLLSHDDIRQFLEKNNEDMNDRKLVEWLSLERATYMIREHIPFILDGDVINYYKTLEKRLKQNNGELLLINVICDLDVVIERLNKRALGEKQIFGNVNYSPADFNTYLQRRFLHSQGNYPKEFFAIINNTHNSEEQVEELWFKLKIWMRKNNVELN